MNPPVTPTREGYGAPQRREVLSPELALVDPELAAHARANLAEPRATLPKNGRSLWTQADEDRSRALTALSGAALALDERPAPRVQDGRSWRVLVGVAAVTVLSLLLFDVRVQVGRTPASAETPQTRAAAPATPSRPPSASVPRPVQKPRAEGATKPQARRFAWAPAPGASGYHVEFFRGINNPVGVKLGPPRRLAPWLRASIAGTSGRWFRGRAPRVRSSARRSSYPRSSRSSGRSTAHRCGPPQTA